MTPVRTMAELHDAGIRVYAHGDRLRLEPTRGSIPSSFQQRIADHKPELVALLASAEGDTLRTLFDLLIDEGLAGATVAALSMRDLRACKGLSRQALSALLRALARSQHMAAGRVPAGWTRVVECAGCGPVLLWPNAPATVTACPWCWHRKAGRAIPKPHAPRPKRTRIRPRSAAT
jgi:hypothetical protein